MSSSNSIPPLGSVHLLILMVYLSLESVDALKNDPRYSMLAASVLIALGLIMLARSGLGLDVHAAHNLEYTLDAVVYLFFGLVLLKLRYGQYKATKNSTRA